MDSVVFLRHLRRELDAFRDCLLRGDLAAPVAHCGDWRLYDLAYHLGEGNLWAATAVTEKHGRFQAAPPPREAAALARWFGETAEALLSVLDVDPDAEAWTFHPPHTVGFWQRRRCHEALVHRWDAQHAVGRARPLDAALAGDGVAEVLEVMAPRQIARGRARAPEVAVRLAATDTGGAWAYGPGDPVATLGGRAEDLLLLLWGRADAGDEAFAWEGDADAARRALAGPLVP